VAVEATPAFFGGFACRAFITRCAAPGRDHQRRIRRRHRIKMDAQRHHIGQQVKRRRDVQQAVLTVHGPKPSTLCVPPPRWCDPDATRATSSWPASFEEYRPHRPTCPTQYGSRHHADRPRGGEERPKIGYAIELRDARRVSMVSLVPPAGLEGWLQDTELL